MEIIMDYSTTPPTCLPKDVFSGELVDITAVGDSYRVFLDPQTGVTHDGAEYAEMARARFK